MNSRINFSPIVIDELDPVTVHLLFELGNIFSLTRYRFNFGRPTVERVRVLSIANLDRSLAAIHGRCTINPRTRLEVIPVLVDKGHRVRTPSSIPEHLVFGIRRRGYNCRVPRPAETESILRRRFLLVISASDAFWHIASNNPLHFYCIHSIHKRNVVYREVRAAYVIDFQSTFGRARSHLPFNGRRLLQHIVNIRRKCSPNGLEQVFGEYDSHRSPFFGSTYFLLVVLVTDIYTRLYSKVVSGALVVVAESLARSKVPRTAICGNIHRKARILIAQRAPVQHKRQLEVLGTVAIDYIVRQIRVATFTRVGVVIENSSPGGSEFARFKVGNHDRLAFGDPVNERAVEHRRIRSISCSGDKLGIPTSEVVVVQFVGFPCQRFTGIFRQIALKDFL